VRDSAIGCAADDSEDRCPISLEPCPRLMPQQPWISAASLGAFNDRRLIASEMKLQCPRRFWLSRSSLRFPLSEQSGARGWALCLRRLEVLCRSRCVSRSASRAYSRSEPYWVAFSPARLTALCDLLPALGGKSTLMLFTAETASPGVSVTAVRKYGMFAPRSCGRGGPLTNRPDRCTRKRLSNSIQVGYERR